MPSISSGHWAYGPARACRLWLALEFLLLNAANFVVAWRAMAKAEDPVELMFCCSAADEDKRRQYRSPRRS